MARSVDKSGNQLFHQEQNNPAEFSKALSNGINFIITKMQILKKIQKRLFVWRSFWEKLI